jgi:hypothetical protein
LEPPADAPPQLDDESEGSGDDDARNIPRLATPPLPPPADASPQLDDYLESEGSSDDDGQPRQLKEQGSDDDGQPRQKREEKEDPSSSSDSSGEEEVRAGKPEKPLDQLEEGRFHTGRAKYPDLDFYGNEWKGRKWI